MISMMSSCGAGGSTSQPVNRQPASQPTSQPPVNHLLLNYYYTPHYLNNTLTPSVKRYLYRPITNPAIKTILPPQSVKLI